MIEEGNDVVAICQTDGRKTHLTTTFLFTRHPFASLTNIVLIHSQVTPQVFRLQQGPSVLHITEGNGSAFSREFKFLQLHTVVPRNYYYYILHILLKLLTCMLKINLFL